MGTWNKTTKRKKTPEERERERQIKAENRRIANIPNTERKKQEKRVIKKLRRQQNKKTRKS